MAVVNIEGKLPIGWPFCKSKPCCLMCQITHPLCLDGSAISFYDIATAVCHFVLILNLWVFLCKYFV